MSTKTLTILVVAAGIGLASFSIFNLSGSHHLGVGWSLSDYNLIGGFLRMLFAFSIGLLMSRIFKPVHIKGAFWICSLAILILLTMPYVGGETSPWMNGIYDAICTILLFPLLVYLAASGKTTDKGTAKICKFLGDISYPVYIIHYPFMYLFYAWLWSKEPHITFSQSWPIALCIFFGSILLAYLCLKLYDEPVRKWLSKKFLAKK